MAIRTLKHGVATFSDAAAAKSVALSPGEGNFSISEMQAGNVESIPVMNRGTFLELVEGAEVPVEFSITILHNTALTTAGTSRVLDAVRGTGNYSGVTSADPGAIVWTGNITVVYTRSGSTDTFTLTNCRLKAGYTEAAEGNAITISGTAYGTGSGNALAVASA